MLVLVTCELTCVVSEVSEEGARERGREERENFCAATLYVVELNFSIQNLTLQETHRNGNDTPRACI